MKLLKHPFILKERSVKPKKVLESLVKEAENIIRDVGSREVALGIQDDEKGYADSGSVEKASDSSTSSSGTSPAGSVVIRKSVAKEKDREKDKEKDKEKGKDRDKDKKKEKDTKTLEKDDDVEVADVSTMKVRGKVVNQNVGGFVPQFEALLQKSDAETKYETMDIIGLKNALASLDKKLQDELDELQNYYTQDKITLQKVLSKRGS